MCYYFYCISFVLIISFKNFKNKSAHIITHLVIIYKKNIFIYFSYFLYVTFMFFILFYLVICHLSGQANRSRGKALI